jgi:hypothetical protein
MTRTDRYREWAALLAALLLLLLVFLVLGYGGRDERQNASGRTEGRSTGAPGPGTDGLVCESSWSTVPSAGKLKKPRAIAAVAKNDIWVVGSTETDAGAISTGAEHWDGSSWSLFRPPNRADGDNALNGVDAVGSKDVWAVGYSEDDGRYKTLVEHWNGARWRIVESPNVGTSQYNTLTSVDALNSTNAWAVGSYRTATSRKTTSRKTLIQRWDGTSWSVVSSPDPGTQSNSLLGVAAADPNDIWAVGWKSSGDGLRSLVLHRAGTRWTEVAVPTVGTGDNVLTGVSAVSGNDVWAAGYYVDGTEYKTLTLHYNGTTWSRVPSPNEGDGTSILRGIGAFSSTDAWAVGFNYRAALHRYVASTQHWDGSTWTPFPSAISRDAKKDSGMFSVAQAPGTSRVWAAGQPADFETICPSGRLASTAPAQEEIGTPTASSTQPPEEPRSVPAEYSASDASVAPTSSGIPVRAVDKAVDAGIAENTRTYGAIIADFNNDRKPDIFLGRHGEVARLYMNAGNGRFKETNKGTFAKTDRHRCDAADVNGDGLKDIFCSTGAHHGTSPKRNELYLQRPDHTFAERAGQYGVFDPFGRGRLGTFIYANGDTHPDLFVANEANRGDAMPSPNRLFINRGGNTYRYAPEYGLEREIDLQESNASVGDLDKDGWQDLILITPSGLHVYYNDKGKGFTDVTASVGLGQSPKVGLGQRTNDVAIADVNGDSWPDVIKVAARKLSVLLNRNGTFSSVFSTTLEYGFSVATGDVNGDNRPDIYVMRGKERGKNATGANAPDQVYLNDGNGTSFTQMSSIPSTSQGEADFVAPIDYDGNGLTDFLVLNGGGTSGGPVQLIAFFRAP